MQEQLVGFAGELVRSHPMEVGAACTIVAMAFSYEVRKAILKRDGGCIKRGQGLCCGKQEAAHKNHDRNSPEYMSMDNGDDMCTNHHLEDHILRAGQNGLSQQANDSAIGSLIARLRDAVNRWED
jgi:hypothetical protein